jgi:hypothetical protein
MIITGVLSLPVFAIQVKDTVWSFGMNNDTRVTIDQSSNKEISEKILILYALPNGNSTGQTMGKKMVAGDDWHFGIQHIRAQTKFIRQQWKKAGITVAYLENTYQSWPAWKTKHADYALLVQQIVDTVKSLVQSHNLKIYLNGHSGGGRFIFSYLDGVNEIPPGIKRISFLDSDYGYDSLYLPKIVLWLKNNRDASLNVFAYNDSVALYEGKPVVSATGGTWWRSWMMLRQLSGYFSFKKVQDDSLIIFKSTDKRIQFFFRTNPQREILHTTQVELNGFIHSILCGTKKDSKHYRYYGARAYNELIE